MEDITRQVVNEDILKKRKYQVIVEDILIDLVNQPPHYKSKGGIESIEVIESFELNFNLGNVIKYILRSDKKGNKKQDLEKAHWYLKREIEKFKG
jgi:hypothetical protein